MERWADRYGKYRQLSNGKYHMFSGKCQLRPELWVPFEDGFKLYLPNDWDVYELS
ncbi:MAG: hypothetical protein ACLTER_16685 [Ruminococcus sp.]